MAKRIYTEEETEKRKQLKKIPPKVLEVLKNSNKKSYAKDRISYNQVRTYWECPTKWYYTYVEKRVPYEPSIHTIFGSAIHETVQHYLTIFYNETAKAADAINLNTYFKHQLKKEYATNKKRLGRHFSDTDELLLYYIEGTHILEYFKKKRGGYFSRRYEVLAGIESLLEIDLPNGQKFMGYIDVVTYDKRTKKWKLIDIKTSTSGWNKWAKKDMKKTSQLLLYKKFFAKKYDIDLNDIDVEFFILKRQVPKDVDFASMQRRIQEFKPTSGKIALGRVMKEFNKFLSDIEENKTSVKYKHNASNNNCKFCYLKDKKDICPYGIETED